MSNVFGALFVVSLGVIFLLLLCKPKVKDISGEATLKALVKAKNDAIAELRKVRMQDSIAINNAGQATADQAERTEAYQNALNVAQATINRLRAKIEGARLEPRDSTWVKVSPHYIEGCDSLVHHIGDLNEKVDEYEEQSAELTKLMHYEIAVRDSALNHEKEFNAKFQAQLNNCLTQLQGKVTAKQRAQLYFGIGLLGNKINPLAGGQVNVSLRARNGQMYEVTGATVGNTFYGGVGTKMLIRVRK